jgi:hypothetical protein
MVDVRRTLEQLIRDRGDDYVTLSRLLGRNAAYMQQFIRRGVPKKLNEEDRRTLARYFDVSEELLGGPSVELRISPKRRALIDVPRLAVGASAGSGAVTGNEAVEAMLAVDPAWLRRLTASPQSVSMISVTGDSMAPTLGDGDDILVDRADAADRLRDGIYVIRIDDALNVKRVSINPTVRTISIISDNPAYPGWPDCTPDQVVIVGRVIWFGRKVV